MKVKLKSLREIEAAGFKFISAYDAPGDPVGTYILKHPAGYQVCLDLSIKNEFVVSPNNAITREVLESFKKCFWVIE